MQQLRSPPSAARSDENWLTSWTLLCCMLILLRRKVSPPPKPEGLAALNYVCQSWRYIVPKWINWSNSDNITWECLDACQEVLGSDIWQVVLWLSQHLYCIVTHLSCLTCSSGSAQAIGSDRRCTDDWAAARISGEPGPICLETPALWFRHLLLCVIWQAGWQQCTPADTPVAAWEVFQGANWSLAEYYNTGALVQLLPADFSLRRLRENSKLFWCYAPTNRPVPG